jgi:hypothetical protein
VLTQAVSKAVYVAPKKRQSAKLKAMFRSAPIKTGLTVTIDLDSDSEPQRVVETSASHPSAVQGKGKGKNIVPTIEKGIQIMQAKEKRMNQIWKN